MAASVSYLLPPGEAGHEEFCARLERLFDRYTHVEKITVHMSTECCFGRLR